MHNDLKTIIVEAEVALLEQRELKHGGPHFKILHRFRACGTHCRAGEEIAAVYVASRTGEVAVPLSLALRLVFDYLAASRRIPQSATQIAAGIHASEFYKKHALNAGQSLRRKVSRSAVKEYIKRIRKALDAALAKAGLAIDSRSVLVSENTCGNEVLYRLRASVEWVHLD